MCAVHGEIYLVCICGCLVCLVHFPLMKTRRLPIRSTMPRSCIHQTPGPPSPRKVTSHGRRERPLDNIDQVLSIITCSLAHIIYAAVDLINRLLQVSRKSRFRISQALNHPWLGVSSDRHQNHGRLYCLKTGSLLSCIS